MERCRRPKNTSHAIVLPEAQWTIHLNLKGVREPFERIVFILAETGDNISVLTLGADMVIKCGLHKAFPGLGRAVTLV